MTENFNAQLTVAVATAVQEALLDATRTVEAPMNRYLYMHVAEGESLEALAEQYGSTLEVLQTVNQFDASVEEGDGGRVVVPVNLDELDPPRWVDTYTAILGDTLENIAERNGVPLSLLEFDNPVLAQRGVIPGDTVFIGIEIIF
jgi:LysM repeat protein